MCDNQFIWAAWRQVSLIPILFVSINFHHGTNCLPDIVVTVFTGVWLVNTEIPGFWLADMFPHEKTQVSGQEART